MQCDIFERYAWQNWRTLITLYQINSIYMIYLQIPIWIPSSVLAPIHYRSSSQDDLVTRFGGQRNVCRASSRWWFTFWTPFEGGHRSRSLGEREREWRPMPLRMSGNSQNSSILGVNSFSEIKLTWVSASVVSKRASLEQRGHQMAATTTTRLNMCSTPQQTAEVTTSHLTLHAQRPYDCRPYERAPVQCIPSQIEVHNVMYLCPLGAWNPWDLRSLSLSLSPSPSLSTSSGYYMPPSSLFLS